MRDLSELVSLVSKNKTKNIEVLGQGEKNFSNKVNALYEALLDGRIDSEEAAIEAFFSDCANPRQALRKARAKLKEKLINTIFFIDLNKAKFNDEQRAYYTCQKEYAALMILVGRGAWKKLTIDMGERLLRVAMKYEFTDLVVNVLKVLLDQYMLTGNTKKLAKASSMLEKYMGIQHAEALAERYYCDLAVTLVKSKAAHGNREKQAQRYVEALERVPAEHRSFKFIRRYYDVRFFRYALVHDYPRMLQAVEEALAALLPHQDKLSPSNFIVLRQYLAACQLHLGLYEDAAKNLDEALKLLPRYSISWFNNMAYRIQLHFHQERYQEAAQIFFDAYYRPEVQRLPAHYKEWWHIIEAFFHFLIMVGKVKPTLKQESLMRRFKLSRFLNEVVEYSKDKQGANITILALQIMFLLATNRHDEVLDRIEALKAYSSRHLRKNETYRSSCFIYMVSQLPLGHFSKKPVYLRARRYIKKLDAMPLRKARQSSELELIPYEQLWSLIYEQLRG
ncbi:MAG: hypothetical protein KatS3mg029_0854 [Saprospiraceae bacterium]|nr:MAG: hypothetical protein KatS3mg029_0854 [Saprospiraceae bacterium]